MFQPSSHQLTPHTKTFTSQEPSISKPLNWSDQCATSGGEMQNGGIVKVDSIADRKQKHEDELQKHGMKVKHHEDNLRFLKTQLDNLDESILDMQVNLGRYYSSSVSTSQNENNNNLQTEENTVDQILQQENSAAGVLCQLKIRHGTYASNLPFTKDVLGIVATLGKVENDNLSRLLSEVLGLETMTAIVCKTYEGVRALEVYDEEGSITKNLGLHGLAPSIGRHMDGRFLAICLEDLRPYVGEFIYNDPQRKLDLLKPRLPNGESPAGFLGFAVNMIILDNMNVSCLTASGHGLRETLFYNLFSRMQVYRTRGEMLQALPYISDGALSLDGAIIKSSGIFYLGNRKEVGVRFPISTGISNLPTTYFEAEKRMKIMAWEKERIAEDIQRETTLLNHAKLKFASRKEECLKFYVETAAYVNQHQSLTSAHNTVPR